MVIENIIKDGISRRINLSATKHFLQVRNHFVSLVQQVVGDFLIQHNKGKYVIKVTS